MILGVSLQVFVSEMVTHNLNEMSSNESHSCSKHPSVAYNVIDFSNALLPVSLNGWGPALTFAA